MAFASIIPVAPNVVQVTVAPEDVWSQLLPILLLVFTEALEIVAAGDGKLAIRNIPEAIAMHFISFII